MSELVEGKQAKTSALLGFEKSAYAKATARQGRIEMKKNKIIILTNSEDGIHL